MAVAKNPDAPKKIKRGNKTYEVVIKEADSSEVLDAMEHLEEMRPVSALKAIAGEDTYRKLREDGMLPSEVMNLVYKCLEAVGVSPGGSSG